ncbi:MAG: hypothetical protein FD129_2841, partial [bacterium]
TGEAQTRIDFLRKALDEAPEADPAWMADADRLDDRLKDLRVLLNGDPIKSAKNFPQPVSITSRVNRIVEGQWNASAAPTGTLRTNYDIAATQFDGALTELRQLVEVDLPALEERAEKAGAPWTPGRLPTWTRE